MSLSSSNQTCLTGSDTVRLSTDSFGLPLRYFLPLKFISNNICCWCSIPVVLLRLSSGVPNCSKLFPVVLDHSEVLWTYDWSTGLEQTCHGGPPGSDVPARDRHPAEGWGGFHGNGRQDEPGAVCWSPQQPTPPRTQSWLQELLLEGLHFLLKSHPGNQLSVKALPRPLLSPAHLTCVTPVILVRAAVTPSLD